jgi:hypothetical protein
MEKDWLDITLSVGTFLSGIAALITAYLIYKTNKDNIEHSTSITGKQLKQQLFQTESKELRDVTNEFLNEFNNSYSRNHTDISKSISKLSSLLDRIQLLLTNDELEGEYRFSSFTYAFKRCIGFLGEEVSALTAHRESRYDDSYFYRLKQRFNEVTKEMTKEITTELRKLLDNRKNELIGKQ